MYRGALRTLQLRSGRALDELSTLQAATAARRKALAAGTGRGAADSGTEEEAVRLLRRHLLTSK